MIPKIIHQLWIGPDPMPQHCVEFCKEMKEMNPEFEHKLWGNEVLQEFKEDKYLYSYLELNSGIPIAFICDRIRLLLLNKYGGIYLDVDCKPIKPFSFIFNKLNDQHCFFAGMKRTQNHHTLIDCAIYGATVNSRVIDDCLSTYEYLNFANGVHLFNNKIIETMEPDIALFGYEYFYNWEVTDKTVLLHDIADTRLFSWVPEDKLPPERRNKRNNKIVE